ncbi:MAG TPA: DUF3040 domain-containing protein [Mycobacterium sp.]|nr:DUF3040 domain-containing protein [Mycobacterium sp.]
MDCNTHDLVLEAVAFPTAFHIAIRTLAEAKLSDDEAHALEGLERALRTEEPWLHARLRDMRPGALSAWQVVLGLVSLLGLGLATAGTVRCCRGSAPGLMVAAPSLALVWWTRRYYCRYCADRWPTPDRSCLRCERPVPA